MAPPTFNIAAATASVLQPLDGLLRGDAATDDGQTVSDASIQRLLCEEGRTAFLQQPGASARLQAVVECMQHSDAGRARLGLHAFGALAAAEDSRSALLRQEGAMQALVSVLYSLVHASDSSITQLAAFGVAAAASAYQFTVAWTAHEDDYPAGALFFQSWGAAVGAPTQELAAAALQQSGAVAAMVQLVQHSDPWVASAAIDALGLMAMQPDLYAAPLQQAGAANALARCLVYAHAQLASQAAQALTSCAWCWETCCHMAQQPSICQHLVFGLNRCNSDRYYSNSFSSVDTAAAIAYAIANLTAAPGGCALLLQQPGLLNTLLACVWYGSTRSLRQNAVRALAGLSMCVDGSAALLQEPDLLGTLVDCLHDFDGESDWAAAQAIVSLSATEEGAGALLELDDIVSALLECMWSPEATALAASGAVVAMAQLIAAGSSPGPGWLQQPFVVHILLEAVETGGEGAAKSAQMLAIIAEAEEGTTLLLEQEGVLEVLLGALDSSEPGVAEHAMACIANLAAVEEGVVAILQHPGAVAAVSRCLALQDANVSTEAVHAVMNLVYDNAAAASTVAQDRGLLAGLVACLAHEDEELACVAGVCLRDVCSYKEAEEVQPDPRAAVWDVVSQALIPTQAELDLDAAVHSLSGVVAGLGY